MPKRSIVPWFVTASWLGACGDDDPAPAVASSTGTSSDTTTAEPGTSSTEEVPTGPWQPGVVYPTPRDPNPRGWLDRRGLVHTHSVYSHDACDGEPMPGGTIDSVCYEDLRRDMCLTQHDFMMLTDHAEFFADTPFPENLLYEAARGDVLVDRGDGPVANLAGCDDGHALMVLAGCESGTLPVGLDHHVAAEVYGEATSEAIATLKDAGAVVLVAHTEDWTVEQLDTLPLDGFEMYNLHANTLANLAAALQLLELVENQDPGLPHPDLAIFPLWEEDPRYLERWGSVLAHGTRRTTTMGTDAHRNTLPQLLPDGERIDSFRRMQQWFSNHLLVAPGDGDAWDDRALEDALRAGRLYGVFEYLGYAEGFDARVEAGDRVVEMGGEVSLADAPEIVAVAPTVQQLDPVATPPEITVHLLRAIEGGFEQVDESAGELRHVPTQPGAYRVEVRIVPRHLREYLGSYADGADEPRVWIYANPFYVLP